MRRNCCSQSKRSIKAKIFQNFLYFLCHRGLKSFARIVKLLAAKTFLISVSDVVMRKIKL